ncbi:hypothetical protein C8J57DRAFT_1456950 [Mycena rebaudengoi]|nr:hypothetical protein C8J57DRAFT_1456950 [Mycena rebaudengoi]
MKVANICAVKSENKHTVVKLRQSKAEKLERGKLASAAYYAKNREGIRTKRRIQMAEKRAALKAKRRISDSRLRLKTGLEPTDVGLRSGALPVPKDGTQGSQDLGETGRKNYLALTSCRIRMKVKKRRKGLMIYWWGIVGSEGRQRQSHRVLLIRGIVSASDVA